MQEFDAQGNPAGPPGWPFGVQKEDKEIWPLPRSSLAVLSQFSRSLRISEHAVSSFVHFGSKPRAPDDVEELRRRLPSYKIKGPLPQAIDATSPSLSLLVESMPLSHQHLCAGLTQC